MWSIRPISTTARVPCVGWGWPGDWRFRRVARSASARAVQSDLMDEPVEEPRMILARRALPNTRSSLTHKFSVNGHEGYLTIGLYDDGAPGEIFIKISKAGSALSGMCQAFCRAFSLAIQHGLSITEATARFKGMRFEPMGATSNPEIPEAESIVDYVAKFLELEFGGGRR